MFSPVHLQLCTNTLPRACFVLAALHACSAFSYTLTKLLLDGLLLRALPAVLYTLIFYWVMGLRPSAAAFFTFLWVFVSFNCLVRHAWRTASTG